MAQDTKTNKILVELTDDELRILKQLADKDGTTATDVLKRAINLMNYLNQQINEGKQIIIGELKGSTTSGRTIRSKEVTVVEKI